MEISNNLNAMNASELKLNDIAKDIANLNTNFEKNPETNQAQVVSDDLIKSITEQIPTTIAYEANANTITTQEEIFASTINIKA